MSAFLQSVSYGEWILHLLVFLPLIGVPVVLLAPERMARHVALALTTVVAVLSLGLWWAFEPGAGMQFRASVPWIPSWGIAYTVGLDGISVFMVLLTTLLMLVAIIVTVWKVGAATGTLSFDYDHLLQNISAVGSAAPWLFAAFALAFAIKVPIFPFHTWLPDAHVEAPTAGSVLLASVMLKVGTYGFLRFAVPLFPDVALSPAVSTLVVSLAVIGIVYGALVAMVQPDFKKLVAYSSVSHMGFVMLGIWSGTLQGVQGALMVMIAHGLSTGALFFLIGMLYERRHTREFAGFGGLARVMPVFGIVLTIVALASIGLPGTNGFVGEFLVLLGSFARHPSATIVATTGVIFAAAYMLWAVQRVIFNRLDRPENEGLLDLGARELVVLLPLLAGIIWMGLMPGPVLRRMEPAARTYVNIVEPHLGNPAHAAVETRP